MQDYFFDTSGLVKRYVAEVGSAWVKGVADPAQGNALHLAGITGVEVTSAVARRLRSGSLSASDAALLQADFRHDLAHDYRVVEITPGLLTRAMNLAEIHALRGYDAVQLAAALEVHDECIALGLPLTLVSADAELNAAARAEGLTVDDPNTHP